MPRGVRQLYPISPDERARLLRKWNQREPMTQRELAAALGISRTRVDQIERAAMTKIRAAMDAFMVPKGVRP